jgi:hypothetical protein
MKSGNSATRTAKNTTIAQQTQQPHQTNQQINGQVPASEMGHEINRDECIRDRAYLKWQEAGCPECDGLQFWLEAEQELALTNLQEVAS